MRAFWAIKPLRLLIVQVLLVDIGQVAVEFRARDATHAVRSKKTRHTTPPNAYLCFFFGKMLEAL